MPISPLTVVLRARASVRLDGQRVGKTADTGVRRDVLMSQAPNGLAQLASGAKGVQATDEPLKPGHPVWVQPVEGSGLMIIHGSA